jgi:hypothetical protein
MPSRPVPGQLHYDRLYLCVLALTVFAIGCDGTSGPAGSEQTCESNCDRQASAGCPTTPAGFADGCKQACVSNRSSYPKCLSQLNALSACVASKIKFACDANGVIATTPIGGCANTGAACIGCTGDLFACAD